MWSGRLFLLLLLQGATTLVDSVAVMSVDLGAEWMKVAVVSVSNITNIRVQFLCNVTNRVVVKVLMHFCS